MSNRIVSHHRARADHDGKRHRAHRVAVAQRHCGGQGFFPAERQHLEAPSPRSPPSRRPNCGSCRRERRRRWSSPTTRPRYRFCSWPCRARDCPSSSSLITAQNFIRTQLVTMPGAAIPYSVRRQAAAGAGRPRSRSAAGERPVADRCSQRDQRSESDSASGTSKIGQLEYDVELNGSPKTVRS